MARVFPTPAARSDLLAIREYSIKEFGGQVADDYFLGFDESFDRLADNPQVGVARPEFGVEIRCLIYRKHRILYQIRGDLVLVVRVIHHAMDTKSALKGALG